MDTGLSRRDGVAAPGGGTPAAADASSLAPVPPMPGPAFPEVPAPRMLADGEIDGLASSQLSQQRTRLSQHRTGLSTHRTTLSTHRTALSEQRTRLSTHRTQLSERRTSLSIERTVMSLDRTLLSWVRTSLSMLTFGFSVVKFFQYLAAQPRAVVRPSGPHNFGVALVAFGIIALSMATWQYVEQRRALDDAKRHSPALLVAMALLVLELVALAYLLFGGR